MVTASGFHDSVTGVTKSLLVTFGVAACAAAGTSAAASAAMATKMERRAMPGNPSDYCRYLHGDLLERSPPYRASRTYRESQ